LYERAPAFHQIGESAYKVGLERSRALDDAAGNPHRRYHCIHIAGTNGKGSVAHLLAAVLHTTGHKVGLYTSPHLVDFRERIRVNGHPITSQYVIDFVGRHIKFIEREKPSFFELTTAMAFDYFRHKKVNYAVIETGLGGRLDSTNIINPVLSIITSISLDHTRLLGNTLLSIAAEKAGIIKPNVPVVIGETVDEEVIKYLAQHAKEKSAPAVLTSKVNFLTDADIQPDGSWIFESSDYGRIACELRGLSQKYNACTVLAALRLLSDSGAQIRIPAVRRAFRHVTEMTGLMGRWQEVNAKPKIVCDIGHNAGAWKTNLRQLHFETQRHDIIHIVIGISEDKDVESILYLLPKTAVYYFTEAKVRRALSADELFTLAQKYDLNGYCYPSVREAVSRAIGNAGNNDFILIGGSAFVVAEALPLFPKAQIN